MFKSKNMLMFVMLLILAAAIPAMALTNGSITLRISEKCVVAGTELQSGDYDIKWKADSQSVTVTFAVHGKTLATAQGKVVGKDEKSEYNALLMKKDTSDRKTVKEIQFAGKRDVITLE